MEAFSNWASPSQMTQAYAKLTEPNQPRCDQPGVIFKLYVQWAVSWDNGGEDVMHRNTHTKIRMVNLWAMGHWGRLVSDLERCKEELFWEPPATSDPHNAQKTFNKCLLNEWMNGSVEAEHWCQDLGRSCDFRLLVCRRSRGCLFEAKLVGICQGHTVT